MKFSIIIGTNALYDETTAPRVVGFNPKRPSLFRYEPRELPFLLAETARKKTKAKVFP